MDWSRAHNDMARQVLSAGDTYLEAQLGLATSADQRAAVMASIFAAAGAVLLGGLITMAGATNVVVAVLWAAGVTAALFLIAAGLCVWATLPVSFCLPGNEPVSYKTEIEQGIATDIALREEVENTQSKIDDNHKVLRTNAHRFTAGAIVGIFAPVVSTLVWCAISFS